MHYKLDTGCHSVSAIQFHLVMCVKYRKKILTSSLDERLKKIVEEIAGKFGVQIIEQKTDMDYIHILFSSRPSVAPSRFISNLKSVASRRLRKEFLLVMKKHLGRCRGSIVF